MIRTIHHQACTGGTLISKCIAALPNLYLLSEINPVANGRVRFSPTELVSQFMGQYRKNSVDIKRKYFFTQLDIILDEAKKSEKSLVIRDHNHPAYMGRHLQNDDSLLSFLENYKTKSLLTIRNPADSFLSCKKSGWLGHIDNNFELYCERYISFVQDYSHMPCVRYEDFCKKPAESLKHICDVLELEYDEDFLGKFGDITLTGDSGRKQTEIVVHPRREVDEEQLKEFTESSSYRKFCEMFDYEVVGETV